MAARDDEGLEPSLRGGEADAAIHAAPGSPRASGPRDDDNTTTTFDELVAEMVREDLKSAERDPLRHCEERSDAAIQQAPGSPRACGPRDDTHPGHCEERSDAAIHAAPGSPRACGPRDDDNTRHCEERQSAP